MRETIGVSPKYWIVWFIFFTSAGIIGSLYGIFFLDLQVESKDLQDHFRFLIYLVFSLFIGSAITYTHVNFFALTIKAVVIFNILTSVIILSNFPILFDVVMAIYTDAKVQFDFSHIRIGIPFANPNFAAFFFLFAFAFFTSFKISPVFAVLSLCSLLLTGSRSGLISLIPLLLALYLQIIMKSIESFKGLLFFVVFHCFFLYFSHVFFESLSELPRFLELVDAINAGGVNKVETASIRIDVVKDAINYITLSPIFGIGPGRYYGLDVTDSQLIAWPLMYGLPTSLLIIGFFSFIFFKIGEAPVKNTYAVGSLSMFFAFILMMSVGDFMKNYRLFFITIMFLHVMRLISVKSIGK
ncbi:MAG: O-antigen ligase family protein [Crocinitomicaceae bacterium]|nr:O-antigen ligase family protein [Crocinitomicaceae bacterium]